MKLLNPNPKFYQKFPAKLRLGFAVLAIVFLGAILFLSLGRASHTTININHADKVAHGFAYFSLGFAALPAMGKFRAILTWGCLTLCGVGVEITQGIMRYGRQGDVFDALANSTGALLAVFFWLTVSKIMTQK